MVDVGPQAGEHGGQILYSGPPEGLREVEAVADAALSVRARQAARSVRRASRPAGCGWKA